MIAGVVAAVAKAMARPDPLVAHFVRADERRTQPWRSFLEAQAKADEGMATLDKSARQSLFVDMAKNAMLTPYDVFVGAWTVFGSPRDTEWFGALVVTRTVPLERLRAHNWRIAAEAGEPFLAQHGAAINALPGPLFPADARFTALNLKILSEAQRGVPLSVYRVEDSPAGGSLEGGAYWAPIVTDAQGKPWADLSEPDEAVHRLEARIVGLETSWTAFRARGRGRGQQGQQGQQGDGRGRGFQAQYRGAPRGTWRGGPARRGRGPWGAGDSGSVPEAGQSTPAAGAPGTTQPMEERRGF